MYENGNGNKCKKWMCDKCYYVYTEMVTMFTKQMEYMDTVQYILCLWNNKES